MKDLFAPHSQFTLAREMEERGLYPYFHPLETAQDTEVIMEGRRTIMLGSNNYLGLTTDPRTIAAAHAALDRFGTGCSGSRFLNGTLTLHKELETELAEFFRKEDCVTFSTGFQTNLGIVSCLVGPHDYILHDSENHASLLDAGRLSFAKKVLKYGHNDMADLEARLKRVPEECGCLIITDGVFSMSGDIADLPEIIALARKYGARVMVDDAHGVGMIGESGRGTASYFGLEDETDIIMTTFSKSLASLGGCMAASEECAHYVRHKSRPFIFSASIPPANAGAALEALRILKAEPDRPKKLLAVADSMRQKLKDAGIPTVEGVTAVVPIYTYDMVRTLAICRRLLDEGVYVNPVLPPAVPENMCMLRTSYTATHTPAQIDEAAEIIIRVFREFENQ